MTDWRALCEELADALDHNRQCLLDDRRLTHPLADKARAALAAEPVGEWPTDTQLIEEAIAVGLAFQPQDEVSEVFLPFDAEEPLDELLVNFARAVLARWGHQPAPPAEGEVAELVALLRAEASDDEIEDHLLWMTSANARRAADLLSQRHPTPVPVSERLPGVEDCDGEGRRWVHQPHEACPESPAWELMLAKYASPNYEAVCWLPATALPLPQGEVE